MDLSFEVDEGENRLRDAVVWARDCLRRRWRTFLAVAALIFVAGTAWVMMMSPRYEAVAQLRLDPARDPMVDSRERQASLSPEAVQTEVSMLNSTELALDVVKRLNLRSDPRFVAGLPKGLSESEIDTAIVAKLSKNLEASRKLATYIIDVRYLSGDPEEAARLANAFMDAYFDRKLSTSTGTAARQAEFLREQLKDIDSDARKAEEEVAKYRSAAGIVVNNAGVGSGAIVDEQIGPLSSQIAMAESAAAAAQADYAAALQEQNGGGVDSVSNVHNSPVIAELRRTRADILQKMGDINTRYGDKHPESIRAREQLDIVNGQIRAETLRIVSALKSDAQAAQARVNSLRSRMAGLEAQRRSAARASVVANALESNATAKRNAYDRLSQQSMTSSQAARNPIVQAEVVERARVPANPVSPNRPVLLTLVLLLSLATGSSVIGLRELLIPGLRTADDVEDKLGLQMLAAVPSASDTGLDKAILLKPTASPFSEALRIAKAAILGRGTVNAPKVIAFPSALPGEGKSTTALAFAGILAASKCKTLLLECDVRRAVMRPLLDMESDTPGLVEVLAGEADASEAIVPSGTDFLDLLLVRAPNFTASDLFGSGEMEALLTKLRPLYDVIVLDLPPLVGLADSRMLTSLADTNVLIVQWEKTPVRAVKSAVSSLRADGANVAGVIYTMVDASAEVVGGLYYRGRYAGYYQSDDG